MSANKPWLKSYPKNVPEFIDLSTYSSLNEIVDEAIEKYRNLTAYSCMDKSITYAQLDEYTQAFANYLRNDLKLNKGDRVAVMMPNLLQYPVAVFGILRAGLVVVNTNPLYTQRELHHQLNDASVSAILVLNNFAQIVSKVLDETPVKHVIITAVGDMLSFPKSLITNLVIKHVKKMVPDYSLPNAHTWKQAINSGKKSQDIKEVLTQDDIAFLQYTGGTTGVAKGAMLTHKNMVANVLQSASWLSTVVTPEKETVITPLPLYHIFALTANCFVFLHIGGHNVLIPNPRDMKGFIATMSKYKFTALTGVNTLFNGLLNHPDFAKLDFSSLRLALGGGMAVQRAVAEQWKKVTKKPLLEAYGLTETSPAACMNPMDLPDYNGSIGLPISSTECSIQDDDGKILGVGDVGEICIRGPQVMKGYWNRDEATAESITPDGWFKTGDIGTFDEHGYFKIVDRKKDMILVSGFNVFPNEIEDVVAHMPGILEVAAIGVPSEKTGEAVFLCVVKSDPNLEKDAIISFCRKELTAYKVPKLIQFFDELPKTNVGKILRRELRDIVAKQQA